MFLGNACLLNSVTTHYRREKLLSKEYGVCGTMKIELEKENVDPVEVTLFDLHQIIQDDVAKCVKFNNDYPTTCIPGYAKALKNRFGPAVVTSFLDSPAHAEILRTVPEEERPPVLLSIYADGLDRDQMARSTLTNKLHCTYLRIINVHQFGARSRHDYKLVMVMPDDAINTFGYLECHREFIKRLSTLVKGGIEIDGKIHAVRLAYLQVNVVIHCKICCHSFISL